MGNRLLHTALSYQRDRAIFHCTQRPINKVQPNRSVIRRFAFGVSEEFPLFVGEQTIGRTPVSGCMGRTPMVVHAPKIDSERHRQGIDLPA